MSKPSDYANALVDEQAVNETYLEQLKGDSDRATTKMATIGMAANVIWGGTVPRAARRRSGALIGRVALGSGDPELRDFYVAPARVEHDRVCIVSWVAPPGRVALRGPGLGSTMRPGSKYGPGSTSPVGASNFRDA